MPSLVPEPAFDPVVLGGALDDALLRAADHLNDGIAQHSIAAVKAQHNIERSACIQRQSSAIICCYTV